VSTRFTKSVIKSCSALSYVEAQARMDDRFVWEEGHHIFMHFFFISPHFYR
jgi:exoribonuclease R